MSATVTIQNVSITLGHTDIVQQVTLTVQRGEWLTVIGPNGAGKSTLLRAIAGLVDFRGTIVCDGRSIESSSRRTVAQHVAFVPQSPTTPPHMTVSEYVLLGRTPHIGYLSAEGRDDRDAAREALERLDLRRFATRPLGSLSGGELQRVVLARALAQQAPVLLLDEPTSALDLGHQQHVLELIDTLRREDALTVISTMHDLSLAGQYADRLVLLDRGRVTATGTASDVLSDDRIAALYGANVHIIHSGDNVFVLPQRRAAP